MTTDATPIIRLHGRTLADHEGVNTSPVEDIEETLQVSESVDKTILARRAQHPFTGIDDLGGIAGTDHSILEKLGAGNTLAVLSDATVTTQRSTCTNKSRENPMRRIFTNPFYLSFWRLHP